MTRRLAGVASLAAAGGSASLVGGRAGAISASVALPLLALGLLFGRPALVTIGPLFTVSVYLAPIALFGGPLDLRAPLLAVGLLMTLELGHFALEGERYQLPGGGRRLIPRAGVTAAAAALGFSAGWAVLLAPALFPAGSAALAVLAGAAAVAALAALRFLRPPPLS